MRRRSRLTPLRQILMIIFCFALAGTSCRSAAGPEDIPWPTGGWESGVSAELDQTLLDDLIREIETSHLDLDGLVVVHKGRIIWERYFSYFSASSLHDSYSITKSVIAALVGVALEQGCIASLDDTVLAYFPEREFLNMEEDKESITVKHLLTMSSGLYYDHDQMLAQMDWIQYTLDQPLAHPPGTYWSYNSGGPQVLSALIERACGMDTLEFADQYLFGPLGITAYRWQRGLDGYPNGSWGLAMKPRDLAKIGYLYLHQGLWDGEQILPADWVELSRRAYFRVPDALEPWELSYGFLWCVHEDGAFAAHGSGGQFIYIFPDHDLVVVITGGIPDSDFASPQILIREYILPAVEE